MDRDPYGLLMNSCDKFIEVDGSVLEGGGQVLRMAVALSAILKKPIHVTKIRLGRSKPGLGAQHLAGLQLAANMCTATVRGAHLGSMEVHFVPLRIRGGHYTGRIRTAGSVSLLVQVALPIALFADGEVNLKLIGGTNVDMAPQIDYINEIFRHNLDRFEVGFESTVVRRGYFPRGSGEVAVRVTPAGYLKSVTLTDPGQVREVHGISYVTGDVPFQLCGETAECAKRYLCGLTRNFNINYSDETPEHAQRRDLKWNGIILACSTSSGCLLGGSGLGKRYAVVGTQAAKEILAAVNTGACLDQYAQDQVILYMALAFGKSTIKVGEITMHTKTAIYVAELMTQVKFNIRECGKGNIIECEGIKHPNDAI